MFKQVALRSNLFLYSNLFFTLKGHIDHVKNKYIYNYINHLGNVRLSYMGNGSGVEIIEKSNYYPFELKHEVYNKRSYTK